MDKYFHSVSEDFAKSSKLQAEEAEGLPTSLGLFLALSILPVLPGILSYVLKHSTHSRSFVIGGETIALSDFAVCWGSLILLSILTSILYSTMKARRLKPLKKLYLPTPKMRFAYCYALSDAIEKYRKTQIEQHYSPVLPYWRKLFHSLDGLLNPFISSHVHVSALEVQANFIKSPSESLFPQILLLRQRFSWFELSDSCKEIVDAFDVLADRIGARLKDKKDLKAVEDILQSLSLYLFTLIPDLPSTLLEDSGINVGEASNEVLHAFVTKVAAIPEYQSEESPVPLKTSLFVRCRRGISWLIRPFTTDVLLSRFASWWFLTQLLVVLAFRGWIHFYPVKADSTIVALLVGSPLALAAALSVTKPK